MSHILATLTIDRTDEGALKRVLEDLHLDCDCHGRAEMIRGKLATRYTLDITEDCLEAIKNKINLMHLTVTKYSFGPLGLKIITNPETIM